jgi:hypothetical protein
VVERGGEGGGVAGTWVNDHLVDTHRQPAWLLGKEGS